jgi:hypothetical protein
VTDNTLCVAAKSLSTHTLCQSSTFPTTQFIDIELLEEVEDDDNETKTKAKTDHCHKYSSDFLFRVDRCCATSSKIFHQSPSLAYKSGQSYLQIFRI